MRLSESGLALLREFEGFRANAYPDPGSRDGKPITIGFGSTRYADGRPIQLGDTITREQADELLRREVAETETAVAGLVKVPLSQSQFDALVSFAFNVGIGALAKSTLLRLLNAGDYGGAADQLLRWNKNDGAVMEGLSRRRQRERAMFLMGPQPVDTRPNDAFAGFDLPNLHTASNLPPSQTSQSSAQSEHPVLNQQGKPMAPVLAALLPSLVSLIPDLARLFGSGSAVAERNTKGLEVVAEKAAEIVTAATNTPNLQAAVETMQRDPAALKAGQQAVKESWYELAEAGGGGVTGARQFIQQNAERPELWQILKVVTYAALGFLLLANVMVAVISILMVVYQKTGWEQLVGIVIQADIGAAMVAFGFWLGSSVAKSSMRTSGES